MFIRKCLLLLLVMFAGLGWVKANQATPTISSNAPIITRVGRSLYAVSPDTGESRLLDEVPPELSQLLKENYSGFGIDLGGISPDNTRLAYSAGLSAILDPAYSDQATALAQRNPNDIYIVDISTGEHINVTNQAATFADAVASHAVQTYSKLTWSQDSSRLYFVVELRPLGDQPITRTLHYYDLETAMDQRVADLIPPPLTADNFFVNLYPVRGGIAALTALDYNGNLRFVLFGNNNKINNQFDFQLYGIQDVNSWMSDYNPIHIGNRYKFGYFTIAAKGPQPNVLDLLNGKSEKVTSSFKVNTISRNAPDTSLRIVLDGLLVGEIAWVVSDSNGNYLITLDNELFISDSAVAPHGQSVAYLGARKKVDEPRDIFIFDGKESHALGFAADEILWGSVEYTFAALKRSG